MSQGHYLLLGGAILGAILALFFVRAVCAPLSAETSFWSNPGKVSPGYVLIAPYFQGKNYDKPGKVLLLDERGHVVHEWKTKYQPLIAYLQPSGHIYVAMTPPIDITAYPSAGTTGLIQELDWEGNVVWEYADKNMTHDIEIMADGGVAYLRWSEAPASFAAGVRGGMASPFPGVWTNEVVVVSRDKKITWTWKPEDHMNPSRYTLGSLIPRHDWTHMNSVRYTKENPITKTPAFMLSSRHLDMVFIVDEKTKQIIWESPKGMFATQHDATFLENGNILVFDNGLFRNVPIPFFISRVAEVDPKTRQVVWTYPSERAPSTERAMFASSIMGSAQRLENGNTLITESTANSVIETTSEGEIVWSYTEYFRNEDGPHVLFKARKYSPENTEWSSQVRNSFSSARMCAALAR